MKKIILATMIIGMMISCTKNEETLKPTGNSNPPFSSLMEVAITRVLDDATITLIGERHNQIMGDAVGQLNWASTNIDVDLNTFFINYNDPDIDATYTSRSDINDPVNDPDMYLSSNANPLLYQLTVDCKNYLLQMPDYASLQNQFQVYRTYVNNNLIGSDIDLGLLFLEVTEKSAYFWMPVSLGGLGNIDNVTDDFDPNTAVSINWGQIAWSDGAGAAGVLLRTWYLAAAPLTWGAIVGAIGWGAAWASGTAILGQIMM